jgi:hypothetical protein
VTRYSPKTGLPTAYQVGPFDSSHLYVQWGGKLPGGEQWSCGFRMWKSIGSTDTDAASVLAIVAPALSAFHTRATTHINAKALLSFVKCNAIDVNGHYIGAATHETTFADLPGGNTVANGTSFPNQVALAVTLQTGFSRGSAHQGRFYLPLPVHDVDATGLISAAAAADVDASLATLRTAVNAGGGEQMVVMSRKSGAPGHRAVTGFGVGRVLDTQRRRRRSLQELYV